MIAPSWNRIFVCLHFIFHLFVYYFSFKCNRFCRNGWFHFVLRRIANRFGHCTTQFSEQNASRPARYSRQNANKPPKVGAATCIEECMAMTHHWRRRPGVAKFHSFPVPGSHCPPPPPRLASAGWRCNSGATHFQFFTKMLQGRVCNPRRGTFAPRAYVIAKSKIWFLNSKNEMTFGKKN